MFDYDLLVIGAGSAGLAAAQRAASYEARVAIAEEFRPGGACVNYGCIPEKLLDYAASFHRLEQVATSYGWKACDRQFNWSHFIQAETDYLHRLNEVHLHHLKDAGVTVFPGHARFVDPHRVKVGDRSLSAAKILIAVGAKAQKPDLPGIEHTITWHELYHLPQQPRSLAVVGDDPIGVKITGTMHVLGTQVTQVLPGATVLPQLDRELTQEIQTRLVQQGVQVRPQTTATRIEPAGDRLRLHLSQGEPVTVETVLMDAPRRPHLAGLDLDNAGVQLTGSGAIQVDARSHTTQPHIFAVGDCTERMPLTPSAIAQGRAFADTEFGGQPHQADLTWVPMSLSSHPEAASVGLSEAQAREKFGDAIQCYRTQFRPLLYCLGGWKVKTFMKAVVNTQDHERILGLHMVGDGAVEIIQSLAIALKLGATRQDLKQAIGIHPSSGEELFAL